MTPDNRYTGNEEMTIPNAIMWIENLIHTMKEETSGKHPDPAYKEEVYTALRIAIGALKVVMGGD